MERPFPALAILLLGLAPAWAAGLAPAATEGPAAARSRDRTVELLDHRCRSEMGYRQVTLFANGTVRLRQEVEGELQMSLAELPPDRLDGVLNRLLEEDLSEVDAERLTPRGDWIDSCVLRLRLDEAGEELRFSHGPFDALPLALSRVLAVVAELGEGALRESSRSLPDGYRPRRGDVLRRVDETLFEVVGFTSDGKGVELQGVDQPLTLYLAPEDLHTLFTALVDRRPALR
jgi:hypothetical protein